MGNFCIIHCVQDNYTTCMPRKEVFPWVWGFKWSFSQTKCLHCNSLACNESYYFIPTGDIQLSLYLNSKAKASMWGIDSEEVWVHNTLNWITFRTTDCTAICIYSISHSFNIVLWLQVSIALVHKILQNLTLFGSCQKCTKLSLYNLYSALHCVCDL